MFGSTTIVDLDSLGSAEAIPAQYGGVEILSIGHPFPTPASSDVGFWTFGTSPAMHPSIGHAADSPGRVEKTDRDKLGLNHWKWRCSSVLAQILSYVEEQNYGVLESLKNGVLCALSVRRSRACTLQKISHSCERWHFVGS